MINSIDAKLLEALLAHRDNQLAAAALQRDEPDPESRRAEIVKYGWDAKKFDKLIRQGVYSAKDIEKARLNLILNLVCTRCVTPYIMFAGQQITQDGSSGQKPITATTKLLSAGVNRLFNKNYDRFCKALMAATDMGLSTKTAQALEALRPESRFDSVKHSRQLPSNSDKTYRPKRARQSMPNLAQGGEFQAQMHKEKEAHESALQSERQADYKDNRDAEIDKFKLAHASDFAEFNFALVFNRLLRAWKHENGEAALGKIAAAMQLLHAQATDVLEDDTAELMEASDKQPPSKRTAHAREVPSTEKKRRESTSTDEASAFGLAQLPEGRRTTLTDFLKTPAYKTSFERYPQLRQIIEEVAVEWVKDGTDGSFSLYLKKAYETELRRCVRLSERAFGRGTKITNDELKKAVGVWRDRPENLGKMMLLDDLQKIMPGSVNVLHLPRMKESSLTRNAEAITEQFLQRADVKAELRNNKPLKQAFLNDIADWLHLGAYSQDPMAVVQRQYNDALLKQYRQGLAAGGTDRNLSDRLRAVAEGLLQNQEGMVLSTRSLDQLLAQLDAAWQ